MVRVVDQAIRRARELPATLASETARPARDAVLDGARSARGTLSVSGIGAVLDVASESEGRMDRATLELSATPRRAWGVVSGTRAHVIRGGRVMPLGGGRFARSVKHPGTPKTDVWGRSTRAARRVISAAADDVAEQNNPFRR